MSDAMKMDRYKKKTQGLRRMILFFVKLFANGKRLSFLKFFLFSILIKCV